jgi:hypothetical protein
MGYLDNTTVTVDAILTNKGRQILASGGQLNITKFALSDDEIDYSLWNPAHTLGTNYYGAVIEAMPIVEANPDETQMMRYKLVTLPKTVTGIPVVTVTPGSITLANLSSEATIVPSTANLPNGNDTLGYTAILSDSSVATLTVAAGGALTGATFAQGFSNTLNAAAAGISTGASVTSFLDDESSNAVAVGTSITQVGKKFTIKPKATTTAKTALVTIIANETGGFRTITVSVSANYPQQAVIVDERTGG